MMSGLPNEILLKSFFYLIELIAIRGKHYVGHIVFHKRKSLWHAFLLSICIDDGYLDLFIDDSLFNLKKRGGAYTR